RPEFILYCGKWPVSSVTEISAVRDSSFRVLSVVINVRRAAEAWIGGAGAGPQQRMSGCPGIVGDFGSSWGRCWGHGKIPVPGSIEVQKRRSICARSPRQNGFLLRWGLCFQGCNTRWLYHTPE